MNIKSVLRTYSLLRQLSDDETALLETLRQLNDSECEALVETLSPQSVKSATTATRKIEHCAACDYTKRAAVHKDPNASGYHEFQSSAGAKKAGKKSPRASSLERQIQKRGRRATTNEDDEDGPRCLFLMGDDAPCNATEHSPVHREGGGYLTWHPFSPVASPASDSSSANGRAGSEIDQWQQRAEAEYERAVD